MDEDLDVNGLDCTDADYPHGWFLKAWCPIETETCGRKKRKETLKHRCPTGRLMVDCMMAHCVGDSHKLSEEDAHTLAVEQTVGALVDGQSRSVEKYRIASEEDREYYKRLLTPDDAGALVEDLDNPPPSAAHHGAKQHKGRGKDKGGKGKGGGGRASSGGGASSSGGGGNGGGDGGGNGSGEMAAALASAMGTAVKDIVKELQPMMQPPSMMQPRTPPSAPPAFGDAAFQVALNPSRKRAFAPHATHGQVEDACSCLLHSAKEVTRAGRAMAKMGRMTAEVLDRECDRIQAACEQWVGPGHFS